MTLYALIDLQTSSIIETYDFTETPPDVTHKNIEWLPLTIVRPALDPTQYRELAPVTVITETDVTITYPQEMLTQEEMDDRRIQIIEHCFFGDPCMGLILLDFHNRLLQLENQSTIDKDTFLTYVDSLMMASGM